MSPPGGALGLACGNQQELSLRGSFQIRAQRCDTGVLKSALAEYKPRKPANTTNQGSPAPLPRAALATRQHPHPSPPSSFMAILVRSVFIL